MKRQGRSAIGGFADRSRRRLAAALALFAGLMVLAAVPGPSAAGAESGGAPVWLVDLDGPLGPASADLIMRAIDDAESAGAQLLVIRMDTPGGLDKSMRELVKKILAADLAIATFVAPDGARAASAGTYIAFASHIAAMAPATNIGSSTPVSIGGGGTPGPRPAPPAPPEGEQGEEQPADPTAPEPVAGSDAMTRKVVNDAVAYLQSLAELRGRNIDWAEETVRSGANLRASEALEKNVVDLVVDDLPSLLEAIDGRSVSLPRRTVELAVAGAGVHRVETDWRHELLTIITDPSIAYGLLIFGFYGLILEFYNPGLIFPSVLGVICLLLGAYGLQLLPVNYAGLALIAVGIAMMIIEVFTPSFGVLAVGGVVAFVLGSLMLLDSDAPGYRVPLSVIAAFAVTSMLLSVFTVGAALRARAARVTTGAAAMIDGIGEAMEDFDREGRVWAFGEAWQASSDAPVARGGRVRITAVDGVRLRVTPVTGADAANAGFAE